MGTLSTPPRSAWLEPLPALEGLAPIDHLFNRLQAAYPNSWRHLFRSEREVQAWREEWLDGMHAAGVTFADVQAGLRQCRLDHADRPPTLGQFIRVCKPALTLEARFYLAVDQMRARRERRPQAWPDSRTFWAAAKLGNDLLAMDYRTLAPRWEAAWHDAIKQADLPVPDVAPEAALPAPGKTTVTQEEGRRRVAEVVQQLASGMTAKPTLAPCWLRIAADPKGFPHVSVVHALRAFRNHGKRPPQRLIDFALTHAMGSHLAADWVEGQLAADAKADH